MFRSSGRPKRERRLPRVLLLGVAATLGAAVLAGCDTTPVLLRGSVSTSQGSRVPGVTVALHSTEATVVATATTNVFGDYEIRQSSGVADGTYRVKIGGRWWPDVSSWSEASDVQISAGTVRTADTTVPAAGSLTATVVDGAGLPVPTALATVVDDATDQVVTSSVTDAGGNLSVDVLAAGSYRLQLAHQDHPLVDVGGATPATFAVTAGPRPVGTIDITTGAVTPPAVPEGPTRLDAGDLHTCGVTTDNTVVCWGSNDDGRSTPPTPFLTFSSIGVGAEHSCGIGTTDTITCWGVNTYGQLNAPTGTFKSVSAGANHTCAIGSDDTISCWGWTEFGLTNPPAGTYRSVAAGGAHTCALATDGTIDCWGYNGGGQATAPTGTFSRISSGTYHSCAVRTSGTIDCWGENSYGGADDPAGTFTEVAAGLDFSCGIATDGTLACWGANNYQQATPPAGTYRSITAGGYHACARTLGGAVRCWGLNHVGQAIPPPVLQ